MSYEKIDPGTGAENPQYAHSPTRTTGVEADLTGGLNAFCSMYNEKAEKEDQQMVESWKSNADSVLHATSLLSIMVTILLGKSYSDLQPFSQHASPLPLTSSDLSTFSPPASTVWVNTLWYMSLVINLTCVLFASLLQQWAYQYLHIAHGVRNPHKRLRIRELMAQGVEKYHLAWVASALPTLFNISIFLFLAGLVISLSDINHTIFMVIFTCVATCAVLYLCFILSPLVLYDCPYYTPLSSLVRSWAAGVLWLTFKFIYRATGWINFLNYRTRLRILDLARVFHRRMFMGMKKEVEDLAQSRALELDTPAMSRVFDSLDGDRDMMQFLASIPGFYGSPEVEKDAQVLEYLNSTQLPSAIISFMDQSWSSDLLNGHQKERRIAICLKAVTADPILLQCTFRQTLRSMRSRIFECVDFVLGVESCNDDSDRWTKHYARCIIAVAINRIKEYNNGWAGVVQRHLGLSQNVTENHSQGDHVKFVNFIHVARDLMSLHLNSKGQFEPGKICHSVLSEVRKFNGIATAPEHRHQFCALWNDLVALTQDPKGSLTARTNAIRILSLIRTAYLPLHMATSSAAVTYSASTDDDDPVLLMATSYTRCNVESHHPPALTPILPSAEENIRTPDPLPRQSTQQLTSAASIDSVSTDGHDPAPLTEIQRDVAFHQPPAPTNMSKGYVGWDNTWDVQRASSSKTIEQQIHYLEDLLSGTLAGTFDHVKYLGALAGWYDAKFCHTGDMSDLEESIDCRKRQLASAPRGLLTELFLLDLGVRLLRAFRFNHRTALLDESISLLRHVLTMPGAQGKTYHDVLDALQQGYFERWKSLRRRKDLETVLLLRMYIDDRYTVSPDKLKYADTWAYVARRTGHPSVSTAYQTTITWMQNPLIFAPTLHTQHAHLASISRANNVLLEYVSYQVQTDRLEEAIEILEQGRALLWSQMRGLRTSIDGVNSPYPVLASKLAAINQELETLSITPDGNEGMDLGSSQGEGWTDAFNDFLKKQRTLLNERDTLTSQIRRLPSFANLLRTPSFDTLRGAASRGPVIIINHCKWRSDILILLHNSPPSLVTTADDFYRRANELADQLLNTRKNYLLESNRYRRTLRSALKTLYELVGEPVMKRLHELNIPEQSRVWWYPTSVFFSLPLHAMGPIPSNDKVKKYFSDVYISSYTSTLSALIKSREPSVHTSDPPSLLIITPEKTLPGERNEIDVIKRVLGSSINSLILEDATTDMTTQGLRHHRFAHFACHGVLDAGKPFDASFKLRDDNRLTLLDIVQSQLPAAEFALLSACHTAELTDGSIADEALQLTAAVQFCGFRSVVGTMWAMADTDGRDLAEHFYELMFFGKDERMPHYERSAKALRDAVQRLRRKKHISLERWVTFVHYGA